MRLFSPHRAARRVTRLLIGLLLLLCWTGIGSAQTPDALDVQAPASAAQGEPVEIRVSSRTGSALGRVIVAVRPFGERTFTEVEATNQGGAFVARLPEALVAPPSFEYFVRATLPGGALATYPTAQPERTPLTVPVTPAPTDERFIVLSPQAGETVASGDVVISASYYRFGREIDPAEVRLELDGRDVTAKALVTADLVVHTPEKALRPGRHEVRLTVGGADGGAVVWTFVVPATLGVGGPQRSYGVTLSNELRREELERGSRTLDRLSATGEGRYGLLRYGAQIYVTTEDDPALQPQNRFVGRLGWGRGTQIEVGDVFPAFSPLVVNGPRMRGVQANLRAGSFGLDIATGQSNRAIDEQIGERLDSATYAARRAAGTLPTGQRSLTELDPITGTFAGYQFYRPGTYEQRMLAVRPTIGRGETGQIGLTMLKATDRGNPGNFILPSEREQQENFVLGEDIRFRLIGRRLVFTHEAAFSLFNRDVNGVPLDSSARAKLNDAISSITTLDNVEKYLLHVNSQLVPGDPTRFGSSAAETKLELTLGPNTAAVGHTYRGPSYTTFGNPFLVQDVAGITLSDRLRLLNNRAFLSVGLDLLHDNLLDQKNATTDRTAYRVQLSLFPGIGLPNLLVGYDLLSNDNKLAISDPGATKNQVQAIRLNATYDTHLASANRLPATASLVVSTSNRDDQTLPPVGSPDLDASNRYLALSLQARWKPRFSTSLGLANTHASLPVFPTVAGAPADPTGGDIDFTEIDLSARWLLLSRDRLALSPRLVRSIGDYQRTQIGLNAALTVHPGQTVSLDAISYNTSRTDENPSSGSDLFVSLRYGLSLGSGISAR